jgi:hypothetical protein
MSDQLDFSFLDEAVFEPLRSQGGSNSKAFRTLAWNDKTPETNWIRVQYAYELMRDNLHGASVFPGAVAGILRSRAWQGYEFRGKVLQASTFREFVEAKPPQGLGTTVEELIRLCQKYPAVVEGIDQILKDESKHGGDRKSKEIKVNNIHLDRATTPKGTSIQRSLRRLRSMAEINPKAARLREQVLRGEISASKALTELGTRKKRYAVEATPDALAAFVKKHLKPAQIKKLIEDLSVK